MTEETAQIQRLDYSKPPLGYRVHCYSARSRKALLHAAWAHYKASNDPPGMAVEQVDTPRGDVKTRWWSWLELVSNTRLSVAVSKVGESDARAASWAWYDRRLALANWLIVQFHEDQRPAWPHCLGWSDAAVAEVEQRLGGSRAPKWGTLAETPPGGAHG
jgi:hypothetical protein